MILWDKKVESLQGVFVLFNSLIFVSFLIFFIFYFLFSLQFEINVCCILTRQSILLHYILFEIYVYVCGSVHVSSDYMEFSNVASFCN